MVKKDVEDDSWKEKKKRRDDKLEKMFPSWQKIRAETCLEKKNYNEETVIMGRMVMMSEEKQAEC